MNNELNGFEKRIQNCWSKLDNFFQYSDMPIMSITIDLGLDQNQELIRNPLILLFGNDWQHSYSKAVIDNSFKHRFGCCLANHICLQSKDLNGLVKECRDYMHCGWGKDNLAAHILFFGLLLLLADSDHKYSKLNILTDFAALMNFNEHIIQDWLLVTTKIIEGKKILADDLKTEEGNAYFQPLFMEDIL